MPDSKRLCLQLRRDSLREKQVLKFFFGFSSLKISNCKIVFLNRILFNFLKFTDSIRRRILTHNMIIIVRDTFQ